jgi:hypothetical protein
MKTLLALVCSLTISASVMAQAPAEKPAATEGEASPDTVKKTVPPAPVRITAPTKAVEAPKQKQTEAAKKAEPKKKEEPKIEGIVVSRGDRGFMGVELVGGAFKITFYDKKKKPVEPDVARVALRWDAKYKVGQERLVLNPTGDGKSLSNPKTIRGPHNFKLYIVLIKEPTEKEDPTAETHVIDFKA